MERVRQETYIRSFATRPEVRRMEQFVQHGNTSCLLHCVAVAHVSFAMARALHLCVREEALSRGALLHDYFLYDWHVRDPLRKKHAFFHPSAALETRGGCSSFQKWSAILSASTCSRSRPCRPGIGKDGSWCWRIRFAACMSSFARTRTAASKYGIFRIRRRMKWRSSKSCK